MNERKWKAPPNSQKSSGKCRINDELEKYHLANYIEMIQLEPLMKNISYFKLVEISRF